MFVTAMLFWINLAVVLWEGDIQDLALGDHLDVVLAGAFPAWKARRGPGSHAKLPDRLLSL